MSTNSSDVLEQAFELIETNRHDEAKALLKPILETDKDNPDIWWVYAHAVSDPETARIALNNVLRIDSSYPDAKNLLQRLDERSPDSDLWETGSIDKEPSFLPSAPLTLPGLSRGVDFGEDDPDFLDDFDEDEEPQSSRRVMAIAAVIGLMLFIGAIVIVITRPFANQPNIVPTATVSQVGVNPTVSIITPIENLSIPTSTADTLTPLLDVAPLLSSALTAFNVPEVSIEIAPTDLGKTLIVDVCVQPGSDLREKLPQVMDILADNNSLYGDDVDGVSARMVDCDTNLPLLMIGVPLLDVVAYADGMLSKEEFQAKWKPIG
ncbi:MAG: tetratricopeptide repeat protein [Anaerolineae bacterium]|nr:tetratricopeptide repeat protein [Anaerolineae bacterium]